ncbi:MAG TPA: hypothetical protein VGO78_06955, partial [Acidimicrobiales bacterium]|nr:hypothetical protein [Acidimicrobiales bacterium]
DRAQQDLLARINAANRVHLSSTRVDGRHTLRLCIIGHRTHHDRVAEALTLVHAAAAATDVV